MPRLLPLEDFRARRSVLTRGDFLIATKPSVPANDRIDKATWDSVVTLPDDVAVRTTNYHGSAIRHLHDLWGAWIECYGENNDCLFPVMLDAADDFQAATYAALTGYYRLSVSAARSALELVAIGTWAQICGKRQDFKDWRAGKRTLSLGQACDGLITGARTLEDGLRQLVGDSLFAQKSPKGEGGFVRRVFDGISNFTHARPGSTDGDMRKSNGPIYVRAAFNHVAWIEFETIALCYVLVLLARPNLPAPTAIHTPRRPQPGQIPRHARRIRTAPRRDLAPSSTTHRPQPSRGTTHPIRLEPFSSRHESRRVAGHSRPAKCEVSRSV